MAASADADGRFNAKDELLYWSDTAPETLTDESLYTLVGLLTNNPFAGQSNELVAADKDASGFVSKIAGSRSYSVNVEANRPAVADAGQKKIRDAWANGTRGWWLITTGVTGDECKHGIASVTAYGEDSSNDDFAKMSATLSGQGEPVFEAVP